MITDFNITKDSEAVERLCENLETEIMVPLNEQAMKLLITLATSNSEKIAEIYAGVNKETPMVKILEDRIGTMGRSIEKDALIFIGLNCQTVGEAVMYAYIISYKMKKMKIENPLGLRTLCEKVFPTGAFSKNSLEKFWDSQKVKSQNRGSDNLLDYAEASKSLCK